MTVTRNQLTATDRRVRVLGWLSLVSQILIVATGGAVRLTGSGLGCPTWPLCTADSLVSTPEMGVHGVIEFGNRTLSVAVGVIAVAVLLAVYRWAKGRQELILLAWMVLLGVTAQALVGGITVLTGLNPFIVGFHYLASISLVGVCTVFVFFESRPERVRSRLPGWLWALTLVSAASAAVTIVLGVVTTGAGPHSGDADAGRNGFDAVMLSHLHAVPSYVLLAATLALAAVTRVRRMPVAPWVAALVLVELAQMTVGIVQSRTGLPPLAVGVHLVLAAALAALVTWVTLATRLRRMPHIDATLRSLVIDQEPVVSLNSALEYLQRRHPATPSRRIRSILVSEWEASSGGVPLVVPRSVLDGTEERLTARGGPPR